MKSLEEIYKIIRYDFENKTTGIVYDASVVCYNAKYTYVATAS